MQRERARDRRCGPVGSRRKVEQTLVEHEPGTVVALLARLEHEQHAPGDVGALGAQQLGGTDQHRGVRVVTAGMHAPIAARREVEPGVFCQRQGVHVAAQQHRRAGPAAFEQRGDPAGGLVERDVEGQSIERLEHVLTGHRQIVAELWPLVQGATQRHHVVEQIVSSVAQRVEFHVRMVDLHR